MYAYLKIIKHLKIRFRVDKPDYKGVPHIPDFIDWGDTPYVVHEEDRSLDTLLAKGKQVILSHYYDVSLMYYVLSGKAVTEVLHFHNKTPINWHCKKQVISETSTYKAEFVAARTCIEQTIDYQNYLRYLGVNVHEVS